MARLGDARGVGPVLLEDPTAGGVPAGEGNIVVGSGGRRNAEGDPEGVVDFSANNFSATEALSDGTPEVGEEGEDRVDVEDSGESGVSLGGVTSHTRFPAVTSEDELLGDMLPAVGSETLRRREYDGGLKVN